MLYEFFLGVGDELTSPPNAVVMLFGFDIFIPFQNNTVVWSRNDALNSIPMDFLDLGVLTLIPKKKTFIFQRECWKEPFYTVIISNPRIWRIRSGPLRESLTLFRFSKNTRRRRQYDDRIQIFSKTRFNRDPVFGLNKFLAHKGTRYRLSIQNTSYAPHAFLEFIRTIFIFNNVVSHVCDYKYYCSSFQS